MTLAEAVAAYLTERDLALTSRRVYTMTFTRLVGRLGPETPLPKITARTLARFMVTEYVHLAPASGNRKSPPLARFFAYTTRQGWARTSPAAGFERRRPRSDQHAHARRRAIPEAELGPSSTASTPYGRRSCSGSL